LQVTAAQVKALRERTSAGVMDCKQALSSASGDINKAEEILKSAGLAAAAKKSGRATKEGLIVSYIHSGNRIGALVEVACETDFVARTGEMQELAHDIAMQIAAMEPSYVSSEEQDSSDVRPSSEVVLLEQTFIKDPGKKIQDIINEAVAKLGENIKVNRFTRFALGE
jgi:elongation factor Ts